MSIGCYDADMQRYTHTAFNLELMKISAYYKRKGHIVTLAPVFSPYRYNPLFYRKDYDDGVFNKKIFNDPTIRWGGLAFSGGKYIPLDEEIEKQVPDVYLYSYKKADFSEQLKYERFFLFMERANHIRLSLDGKDLWNNLDSQFKVVTPHTWFIHDYNITAIKDSYELLKELTKVGGVGNKRASIATKFPIKTQQPQQLLKWCTFQPAPELFNLQYNNFMLPEVMTEFLQKTNDTSIPQQLEYYVTGNCFDENEFLEKRLRQIYLQVCFLRSQHKRISLKYEEGFFLDKRWERLLTLWNCYLSGEMHLFRKKIILSDTKQSLNGFCSCLVNHKQYKTVHLFDKAEAKELFEFVKTKDYELFKLFFINPKIEIKNGRYVLK